MWETRYPYTTYTYSTSTTSTSSYNTTYSWQPDYKVITDWLIKQKPHFDDPINEDELLDLIKGDE